MIKRASFNIKCITDVRLLWNFALKKHKFCAANFAGILPSAHGGFKDILAGIAFFYKFSFARLVADLKLSRFAKLHAR